MYILHLYRLLSLKIIDSASRNIILKECIAAERVFSGSILRLSKELFIMKNLTVALLATLGFVFANTTGTDSKAAAPAAEVKADAKADASKDASKDGVKKEEEKKTEEKK